ncbi:MAG: nitroreductase family protein [Bacteroidales bacterium]|nr:nitroreductase family protein [Bacteroidales bacterium]
MLDNILKRSSVRRYEDKEISQEMIDLLLNAGFSAPCSKDSRPLHFIVLEDKVIMTHLGENLKYASMLRFANKAIMVCADKDISPDCWMLDACAATENILIAATELGIGSVWTAVYPYEDRQEVVQNFVPTPENIKVLSIIPLGYPAKEPMIKDKFDANRIHYDSF